VALEKMWRKKVKTGVPSFIVKKTGTFFVDFLLDLKEDSGYYRHL